MVRHPLEFAFLTTWFGYFGLIWLAGFRSTYDNLGLALSYQILFVGIFVGTFAALPRIKYSGFLQERKAAPYVVTGIVLSYIGILALFMAKSDAGVVYSTKFCQARYQMSANGHLGTPLSVFGNLFSYAFFVSAGAVITMNVTRRLFWIGICSSATCLLILAIVTSSRSTIMLFGAFCLSCICIRLMTNRPLPKMRLMDLIPIAVIIGLIAIFVLSVFACRADASHLSMSQYQERFEQYLGMSAKGDDQLVQRKGRAIQQRHPSMTERAEARSTTKDSLNAAPDTGEEVLGPTEIRDQSSGLVGMTVLYLVHSAYTFDGILSMSDAREGHILLRYARQLLSRLGMMSPADNWVLTGRFASLPGALYHDLGIAGLIGGSALLAFMAWAATAMVRLYSGNIFAVGTAAMLFTILLLSPLHPAQEFMAFPFICIMFMVVPLLAYPFSKASVRRQG